MKGTMKSDIIYSIKELQVTLSNSVANLDPKYNNLWIQRYLWYTKDKEKMR